MFARIDRYAAVMIISIKQELAYKKSYFISLAFRLLFSLIMIAVWTAVYLNTDVTKIGGFTLPQMYVYFFLINAIAIVSINIGIADDVQQDIQNGTVATSLIRPMAYPTQIFLNSFARSLFSGLVVTLPFLLLISPFAHLALTLQNVAFFLMEIALSYLVSTLIFFLIGLAAVYMVYIWGILAVTDSAYYLISGGVIPLNLFPPWLWHVLSLLPMQLSLYVPAATLLGIVSKPAILSSLLIGIVWVAGLFAVAAVLWRRVSVKITSAGG